MVTKVLYAVARVFLQLTVCCCCCQGVSMVFCVLLCGCRGIAVQFTEYSIAIKMFQSVFSVLIWIPRGKGVSM